MSMSINGPALVRKRTKLLPLPEAQGALGSGFRIKEGKPFVQFGEKRVLSAPLDSSKRALFARTHETAHIKWTQPIEAKLRKIAVDPVVVNAAEDARLHALMVRARLGGILADGIADMMAEGFADQYFDKEGNFDKRGAALGMASVATVSHTSIDERSNYQQRIGHTMVHTAIVERMQADFTKAFQPFIEAGTMSSPAAQALAAEHNRRIADLNRLWNMADKVRTYLGRAATKASRRGKLLDDKHTAAVAHWLAKQLELEDQLDQMEDERLKDVARDFAERDGNRIEDAPKRAKPSREKGSPHGAKPEMSKDDGAPRWGAMRIKTPPLTTPKPRDIRKAFASGARDAGTITRHIHRYCVDQAVFHARRLKRGAAVLVDISGSMSLSEADIEEIIRRAPAALVATYCGCHMDGELTIVAKNGKMVRTIDRYGHNNLIDGPALKWLAKQPGPRFWVSDGYVTTVGGAGENLTARAVMECEETCRRGCIKRVDNVEGLLGEMPRR